MSNPRILAELHSHTTYSDGVFTPRELAERVAAAGVRVWSLTDHDTCQGCDEAATAASELDIEFIPGIEMSAYHGRSIHILGYGVDPHGEAIRAYSERRLRLRRVRMQKMVENLVELGIQITMKDVESSAGQADAFVRPHLARALVTLGEADSVQDAFERYLRDGGPVAVESTWPSVLQAIDIIHQAGGVAVSAHPGQYRDTIREPLFAEWVERGLDGVECMHPRHDEDDEARYLEWAERYGVLKTASSDYHGPDHRSQMPLGQVAICRTWLDGLKNAMEEAKRSHGV